MKLSIIIVNFNTKALTADCLRSIDKFPPNFSFEVIVVDNASTDGSVAALRKLKLKKFRIRLIENEQNLGFSKANNIGINSSKGMYVLLLNSDTVLINNVLDELVSFAEGNKDAGVVAPKLLNTDKSVQPSIFHFPGMVRAVTRVLFEGDRLREKYALNTHEPTSVDAVVGAAFLITPQARKKVGLLDEKYFMYFEDLDYCRSVNREGLKVYYLPDSSLIHIHGGSSSGKVNKYSLEAGKMYFGTIRYYGYTLTMRIGNKLRKIFNIS